MFDNAQTTLCQLLSCELLNLGCLTPLSSTNIIMNGDKIEAKRTEPNGYITEFCLACSLWQVD